MVTLNTYNIKPLTATALDNASFYQLIADTLDSLERFISEESAEVIYQTKADELKKRLAGYDGTKKTQTKSQTAGTLEQADEERDDALTTLTNFVKAYAKVKDAESQAAYSTLSAILKDHKVTTTSSYEKESAAIASLLKAFSSEKAQEALETLNLTPHITTLQSAQKAFDKAYKARIAEQKAKPVSQTRELRRQLLELYNFIIDFTAINAYAYPEKAELVDLHKELNTIRSRYKKRKSTKTNEVAHETTV